MPEIVEEYGDQTLIRQGFRGCWNLIVIRHRGRGADGKIYRYCRIRQEHQTTGEIREADYNYDFSVEQPR